MDFDVSHFELTNHRNTENANVNASPAKEEYKKELAHTLMQTDRPSNKVLAFQNRPQPTSVHESSLRVLYTQNREAGFQPKKYSRHIPQAPERILDAPELLDDYYLNLLDWSSTNVLGVALGDSIYLWNASDGSIQQLMQTQGEQSHVTSLSWIGQGNFMAVGTSDHKVQIWDVEKLKQVRQMDGHRARVSSLAWNGPMLSSGGRDSAIIHHDVREARHKVGQLRGHTQEVCGLKWSPSGTQLASGGNDNLLNIWDDRYTSSINGVCDTSLHRLDAHQAAVKALAWCPWQKNLLASGGGTADRMIRFWNTNSGACLNEVDTHSQVCALQWSQHDKELVSSHGYSHNQLILWKYPSMVKVAELTGHTSRVLHMAQSPDGTTVVTAAADETLRFWKILSGGDASKKERAAAKDSILNSMSIR
jgi:cell division cycle protein 20 (cofactor of APC complex)